MADLIAKIGRFFAEQEAQIQETFTHVAQAPARLPAPSRPPFSVHRIPTHLNAHPPAFGSPVPSPAVKPTRSNSLVRRRLSLRSAADSTPSSQEVQYPAPYQTKAREVPSLPPRRLPTEDIWSQRLSGDLISWASSSPASTDRSGDCSSKDEHVVSQTSSERERKPRPPQQKHRKRSRNKKRGVRSGNQEEDEPDPKEVAQANAEKIAAALVVAQERARRIHHEKLHVEQERELERQEAALRLEEQMLRIEAVRAKSFRQSSSSLMTTTRSSLSESGSSHDRESAWTADANEMEPHRTSSPFMMALETQLREKMSLEMLVKQSCIEKHKQRERVRLKLARNLHQNAVHSSKVARLSAMKASLEMELAVVLEETAQTRQERRELELSDEKERLKRQREAERELQIRLREEEWSSMMEDEKARSQVAAQARVKASKRVEAHSAKLREMLEYRCEPQQITSSGVSASARSSNNDSDESEASSARQSTEEPMIKPAQAFKMNVFLPPELADFEEDGLYNSEQLNACTVPQRNWSRTSSEEDKTFTWQIPSFPDKEKFTKVLLDMLSDDEE